MTTRVEVGPGSPGPGRLVLSSSAASSRWDGRPGGPMPRRSIRSEPGPGPVDAATDCGAIRADLRQLAVTSVLCFGALAVLTYVLR
jgi:hypothetical protein